MRSSPLGRRPVCLADVCGSVIGGLLAWFVARSPAAAMPGASPGSFEPNAQRAIVHFRSPGRRVDERSRQDERPPPGTNLEDQLVAAARQVEVTAGRERQLDSKHIGAVFAVDSIRLTAVVDAGRIGVG